MTDEIDLSQLLAALGNPNVTRGPERPIPQLVMDAFPDFIHEVLEMSRVVAQLDALNASLKTQENTIAAFIKQTEGLPPEQAISFSFLRKTYHTITKDVQPAEAKEPPAWVKELL